MDKVLPKQSQRLGLSSGEAEKRLDREGFNELPQSQKRSPIRIVLEVMREPMLALLIGGGVVYLLLGDLQEALNSFSLRLSFGADNRCSGGANRARS